MISADHLWILALALILDAILGDPDWLWRHVPHPVVVIGGLIDQLDRGMNRDTWSAKRRKFAGTIALFILVSIAATVGWALESLLSPAEHDWTAPFLVVLVAIMLAGRSLNDHVTAVARAYETAGLDRARREISKVVGRDPAELDEAGLSRAAIESLAENFSDGLLAPAFWFALLGLPGLLAYKAINTADSMIGHRSHRYRDFGWASARLDDLVNWLPARLSALLIAIAASFGGTSIGGAFRCIVADAGHHRSPNAGWPEAAMAGALGISLCGPRSYGGTLGDEPYLNAEGNKPGISDIRRALRLYVRAWMLIVSATFFASLAFL